LLTAAQMHLPLAQGRSSEALESIQSSI